MGLGCHYVLFFSILMALEIDSGLLEMDSGGLEIDFMKYRMGFWALDGGIRV